MLPKSRAPEMRAWLEEHGADRRGITQSEFARFVLKESESAKPIFNLPAEYSG